MSKSMTYNQETGILESQELDGAAVPAWESRERKQGKREERNSGKGVNYLVLRGKVIEEIPKRRV